MTSINALCYAFHIGHATLSTANKKSGNKRQPVGFIDVRFLNLIISCRCFPATREIKRWWH
jgi:hypothetical protein